MRANQLIQQKNIFAELHPCLPYSLAFDILAEVESMELNNQVYRIFSQGIPLAKNYDNNIDLWVDLEVSGNIKILIAKQLAEVISHYIKEIKISVILNIRKDVYLTADNKYFLEYLFKFSNGIKVVYQDMHKAQKNLEQFLRWDCFIDPKQMDFENDSKNICQALWRLAELGAEEAAFNLFEKAIMQVHSSYLQNLYLVQLQFMRLASMHYKKAAEESREVSPEFSELLQSFYLTKAWGNILIKRVAEAGHYFNLANIHENLLPANIDQLYKMNIFALYKHLSGETTVALFIENKIKNCILNLKTKRPQITYINAINLARLYRHINDFQQAKLQYAYAFEHAQIHSESHHVYINLCYSLLYEKQQNWQQAFDFWRRAWLQWCKMKTPEALTWRAVRAIGIFDFQPHERVDKDGISECFLKKLNELAIKKG